MINFRPKLAFFDIDGTLLGSDHALSSRTIEAISKLKEKHVRLAFATGRPSFATEGFGKQLGIDSWSLFFSGALISNPATGETLSETTIDQDLIYKTIQSCKELDLYLELYSNSNYFVEKHTELTPTHSHYMGFDPQIADFEDLIQVTSIIKLLAMSKEQQDRQGQLITRLPELKCLCSKGASHPEIIFNNITSLKASRIDGFNKIIQAYNIKPEQVISFGDASSDIDFLQLSGFGVAMGNAPDHVKLAADFVTDTADNDGVAKVIEKIISAL